MIDYDPISGRDLSWYWEGSYILVRDKEAGYLPAAFAQTVDDEYHDTFVRDMPPDIKVSLRVPSTAAKNDQLASLGLPTVPSKTRSTAYVHPSRLFENDEEFITYRVPLGYVPISNHTLLWASVTAPRTRSKGLSPRCVSISTEVGADAYSNLTEQLMFGICIRLDGRLTPSRSEVRRAVAGEIPYAYVSRHCVVMPGGKVLVDRSEIGVLDSDLRLQKQDKEALASKYVSKLINGIKE